MTDAALRPDIEQAAGKLTSTFGSKREIRKLQDHLWEREVVEMLATGWYGKGNGLLALTNQRLIFLLQGWVNQQLEDFPISRISSVQWSAGVIMGSLTVFSSGNKSEISQVGKAEGKAMSDRLRAHVSGQTQAPAPPAAPAPLAPAPAAVPEVTVGPALLEQLQQLAALHDIGALTDAEFTAAKAKLIGV
ncbi:MAG: hypothetical protein GEU83_12340 [Pseudonocardiaceae bacterium]|nr:hypothetical protein [Pseudonocardiaceae bacterium]